VAAVSKGWREVYATLDSVQLTVYDEHRRELIITCDSQVTLYSSVFCSSSRVQLAHDHGLDCTSEEFQLAAGKYAHAATLAVAHRVGMAYTPAVMAGAARCNKLAEVQFLRSQGCPWSQQLLELACRFGHSELVRWCHEHGCLWDDFDNAPRCAAESGNVELMAWVLQQPGTFLSTELFSTAASKGHIAMCRYLYTQQCPWSAYTTRNAGLYGHASMLRWLVDHGCPYNLDDLCNDTQFCRSLEVLTYLLQQGLLTDPVKLRDMLDYTGRYNNLVAAKLLRKYGAGWPTEFAHGPWSDEALT
jgi:hypothetical protein